MSVKWLVTLWTLREVLSDTQERDKQMKTCGFLHDDTSRKEKDILCHKDHFDDDLPLVNKAKIPDNSIFFIETSCRNGLTGRQACCVESAARAHPHQQINVLFAGPVRRHCLEYKPMNILLNYRNVKFFRVDILEYSKDSPLEEWVVNSWDKNMNMSVYPLTHTSDILRYLTLYKFGGVYLDLDLVVARPLNTLPRPINWLAMESSYEVGSAAIGTSRTGVGKRFTSSMLRIIANSFDPNCWACNTRGAEEKVIYRLCSTTDFSLMSAKNCQGIEIYNTSYFYPIPCRYWTNYFAPTSLQLYKKSFAFHIWNSKSQARPVSRGSLYGEIAKAYCPKTSYRCETFRSGLDCTKEDNRDRELEAKKMFTFNLESLIFPVNTHLIDRFMDGDILDTN